MRETLDGRIERLRREAEQNAEDVARWREMLGGARPPEGFEGSEICAQEAERVAGIIRGRAATHGDALEQHTMLAALWSDFLEAQGKLGADAFLSAKDVLHMMVLLKVSRINTNGLAREHVEDIAGYAALTLGAIKAGGEL